MQQAQHAQPRRANRRRRMRPAVNGRPVLVGANQALQRVNNPTGGAHQTGSDLLTALTIPQTIGAGELLADIVITPSIAARLATLAGGWQRVRYNRLTFEVNASASSIVGGEFVAAFVSDPTDKPPLNSADKWVKAHAGSITSSWWKSTNVRGPCPPQVMYTSFEENEPRFSSPGRFVLAVVNPPTSEATMSISLNWAVTFSQPSLESFDEEQVYTLSVNNRLLLSDGTAGQGFVRNLVKQNPDGSYPTHAENYLTPDDFEPALPVGVFLKLPQDKALNSDTGASGAPETAIVTHIGVISEGEADDGRLGYYYVVDDSFVLLKVDKPFSIRPMNDSINMAGTIYESEPVSELGNDEAVVFARARARRSLTSGPVLTRSSKGKILSSINRHRF